MDEEERPWERRATFSGRMRFPLSPSCRLVQVALSHDRGPSVVSCRARSQGDSVHDRATCDSGQLMKRILLRHMSLALACVALGAALISQAPGAEAASTTMPYPMLGTNLTTDYVAAGSQPAITVTASDPTNTPNTGVTEYLWGPLQVPTSGDCSTLTLAQFDTESPGVGIYTSMIPNLLGTVVSASGSVTIAGPVAATAGCYGWTTPITGSVESTSPITTTTTTTVPAAVRTTITCMRGRTTKKVAAVSPKCPSGYKRASTISCVKGLATRKVTAVSPKCPRGYKEKKSAPKSPVSTTTTTIPAANPGLASCGDCGVAALINADRASVGVAPLVIIEDNPVDELSALLFVSASDDPGMVAWNIAPTDTPQQAAVSALDAWWAEGPGPFGTAHGHYDDIVNPNYMSISVSVAFQPAGTPFGPCWVVVASF